LSIAADGERKMTGNIQRVSTRFEQVAQPGFFRIWCGLHQLDLKLFQKCYTSLIDESFYHTMTTPISYLQCQYKLVAEMKTKAQLISDTRCESMYTVSTWFKVH
jgi:hypothetical protein